jgi:hypothetical protein
MLSASNRRQPKQRKKENARKRTNLPRPARRSPGALSGGVSHGAEMRWDEASLFNEKNERLQSGARSSLKLNFVINS